MALFASAPGTPRRTTPIGWEEVRHLLAGMASALNIAPYGIGTPTPEGTDWHALAADWDALGEDADVATQRVREVARS